MTAIMPRKLLPFFLHCPARIQLNGAKEHDTATGDDSCPRVATLQFNHCTDRSRISKLVQNKLAAVLQCDDVEAGALCGGSAL
jgi:hypothetical protein